LGEQAGKAPALRKVRVSLTQQANAGSGGAVTAGQAALHRY